MPPSGSGWNRTAAPEPKSSSASRTTDQGFPRVSGSACSSRSFRKVPGASGSDLDSSSAPASSICTTAACGTKRGVVVEPVSSSRYLQRVLREASPTIGLSEAIYREAHLRDWRRGGNGGEHSAHAEVS